MWWLLLQACSARLIAKSDVSFLPATRGGNVRVSWFDTAEEEQAKQLEQEDMVFAIFPLSACHEGMCTTTGSPIAKSPATSNSNVVNLQVPPNTAPVGHYGIVAVDARNNNNNNHVLLATLTLGPDLVCPSSAVFLGSSFEVAWESPRSSDDNGSAQPGSEGLVLAVGQDSVVFEWQRACKKQDFACVAQSRVRVSPARISTPGVYKVQLLSARQQREPAAVAECEVKIVAAPSISASPSLVHAGSKITVNWKNVDVSSVDTYIAFWQRGKTPFVSPAEPVALVEGSWGYIYDRAILAKGLVVEGTSPGRQRPPSRGSISLASPLQEGSYTVYLCYNNCDTTPCQDSCVAHTQVIVTAATNTNNTASSLSPPSSTTTSSSSFSSASSSAFASAPSPIIVGTDDLNSVRASSYDVDQGASINISWSCFPADTSHARDVIGLFPLLDDPENITAAKQIFPTTGKNADTMQVTLSSAISPGVYVLVHFYSSGLNSKGAFVMSSPIVISKQGLRISVTAITKELDEAKNKNNDNNNDVDAMVRVKWELPFLHSSLDCLRVCVLGASCLTASPPLGSASAGLWDVGLPYRNTMFDIRYFPECGATPVGFSRPISGSQDSLTYTSPRSSELSHALPGAVDSGAGLMFTLGAVGPRSVKDALVIRRASDPPPSNNPYSLDYATQAGEMIWVYVDSVSTPTLAVPFAVGPGYYYAYYFSAQSATPVARSALIQATPLSLTCPSTTTNTNNAFKKHSSSSSSSSSTVSDVKHLVVVITENHSFDSIFGSYCSSPPGQAFPPCTQGPECCEAAPATVTRASGVGVCSPNVLTNAENAGWDRAHSREAIKAAVNDGLMDQFVSLCSSHGQNFAVSDASTMDTYFGLAANSTLIDNYWQSAAGASCQSDVFLARAGFVFYDNAQQPAYLLNPSCYAQGPVRMEPTIAHMLLACGHSFAYYGEGMDQAKEGCYPFYWDPTDSPFAYFHRVAPLINRDLQQLYQDIKAQQLPSVSYVKGLGIHSEHGGMSSFVESQQIVRDIYAAIQSSVYAEDTVLIVVPDEGGGFYDHVGNTNQSTRWPDGQAGARTFRRPGDSVSYGGRLPFLAAGRQVKENFISHAFTEHTSIVKFQEFNWLGGLTGQLGMRDVDPAICNLQSIFNSKAGTLPSEQPSCN